jgi:hypothetical protein
MVVLVSVANIEDAVFESINSVDLSIGEARW